MDILQKIVKEKRSEVDSRKALFPTKLLEGSAFFDGKPISMSTYVRRGDKSGIIAEFKRKSPSKGVINAHASVEQTSIGYMQAGASALSILTDSTFFGGSNEDLKTARSFNFCPILRKDFLIDEYQVIEAKSIGADAILLIAAILEPEQIRVLGSLAQSLGMEVLLEITNEEELKSSYGSHVNLVGVNNRDLRTFQTDIETSKRLVKAIPDECVKISESGISLPEHVAELRELGFEGFLIGGNFMRHSRPDKAASEFIKKMG